MNRRAIKALVLPLAIAFAIPGPAVAKDEITIVDPDSPAGQEYSVPLDRARHHGAGDTSFNAAPGQDAAAPFGAGVTPPGSGPGGGTGGGSDPGTRERLSPLSSDAGSLGFAAIALAGVAMLVAIGTAAAAVRLQRT